MVPWSVMSDSDGVRRVSNPDKPLRPDDEEALRKLLLLRRKVPEFWYDGTESSLEVLEVFILKYMDD